MELAVRAVVFAALGDLWRELWPGAGRAESGGRERGGRERGHGLCDVRCGCVAVGAKEFWEAWQRGGVSCGTLRIAECVGKK